MLVCSHLVLIFVANGHGQHLDFLKAVFLLKAKRAKLAATFSRQFLFHVSDVGKYTFALVKELYSSFSTGCSKCCSRAHITQVENLSYLALPHKAPEYCCVLTET